MGWWRAEGLRHLAVTPPAMPPNGINKILVRLWLRKGPTVGQPGPGPSPVGFSSGAFPVTFRIRARRAWRRRKQRQYSSYAGENSDMHS
eukprot:gene7673-biopygen5070